MIIIQNLIYLLALLAFFSVLGLGISSTNTAKNNLALLPVFGFAALIGLGYIISANFKISGANATGFGAILLTCIFFLRLRRFFGLIYSARENGELYMFFAIIAIPILTLLIPAILTGFNYFYGYVNYDFYYNSQDSWFLKTHNVIQYYENNVFITPLNWSANSSGRIAVGLLGAFFSNLLNLNTLEFNSLLLNTLVILFALSISVFCKEFFNFGKKTILLAVFFSVMSAGYVQAYSYYVLGQISVIPVFIVFCIYLKNFLDSLNEPNNAHNMYRHAIIIALLLNVLFILYAIVSFFAAAITISSYAICLYNQKKKRRSFLPLLKAMGIAILLFCLVRILIVPESLKIIKSWIMLSNRVAEGRHDEEVFVVFSEYLTEVFPALFFGLANYLTTNSIFKHFELTDPIRIILLTSLGLGALVTTIWILISFTFSEIAKSSKAIIISLFTLTLSLAICFFFTSSGYGIFKLQTWFMPILITTYVYFLFKTDTTRLQLIIKASCGIILILNVFTGIEYLDDFFTPETQQRFINVHGVTRNRDINDLAIKLKSNDFSNVSLFLTNGMETAWLANSLRTTNLNKVIHNTQLLLEKEFKPSSPLGNHDFWPTSGVMIITNPNLTLSDITMPPDGMKIIYSNKSYMIIDPSQIKTFIYLGSGTYPVEYFPAPDNTFPTKFRWAEKGVEVMIYSNQDKLANLLIEITPGYVDAQSKSRQIHVKTESGQHTFSIQSRTMLTIPNLKLHKGINYITLESPDKVTRMTRYGSLMRSTISLDPRLNNFAISYVGIKSI